jgi:hypothetical protein
MSTIVKPSDYNDPNRVILKFHFKAQGTLPTEEVVKVSNEKRPNVGPQSGCAVVLDSSSVGVESLYELSGLRITKGLSFYGLSAFGFCDLDSLDKVRAEWETKAREVLMEQTEALESAIENAKTLRRCIG